MDFQRDQRPILPDERLIIKPVGRDAKVTRQLDAYQPVRDSREARLPQKHGAFRAEVAGQVGR